MVSKHYGYNISRTVLFSKIAVRIRLDARIRTIVILTGGKLTCIYFLHLLSVTMHLHQRKNVRFIPSGDVNLGPIPLR
jgi:hypothetical protein